MRKKIKSAILSSPQQGALSWHCLAALGPASASTAPWPGLSPARPGTAVATHQPAALWEMSEAEQKSYPPRVRRKRRKKYQKKLCCDVIKWLSGLTACIMDRFMHEGYLQLIHTTDATHCVPQHHRWLLTVTDEGQAADYEHEYISFWQSCICLFFFTAIKWLCGHHHAGTRKSTHTIERASQLFPGCIVYNKVQW